MVNLYARPYHTNEYQQSTQPQQSSSWITSAIREPLHLCANCNSNLPHQQTPRSMPLSFPVSESSAITPVTASNLANTSLHTGATDYSKYGVLPSSDHDNATLQGISIPDLSEYSYCKPSPDARRPVEPPAQSDKFFTSHNAILTVSATTCSGLLYTTGAFEYQTQASHLNGLGLDVSTTMDGEAIEVTSISPAASNCHVIDNLEASYSLSSSLAPNSVFNPSFTQSIQTEGLHSSCNHSSFQDECFHSYGRTISVDRSSPASHLTAVSFQSSLHAMSSSKVVHDTPRLMPSSDIADSARPRPLAPKSPDESWSAGSPIAEPQYIHIAAEDGTYKKVAAIPKRAPYVRPSHPKKMCRLCNDHPDGFRGEHELRRHMDRTHKSLRKMWVCVNASQDPKFLSGCKHCRNGKKYGAYYNAAAHLRRQHFNPRPTRGRGRNAPKSVEKRGGMGGGDNPPMEVLKKYMKEVDEFVPENFDDDYFNDLLSDGYAADAAGSSDSSLNSSPMSTQQCEITT